MSEDASGEDLRGALSHLAGGVVIVTTRDLDGEPRGMTATAVCSVSLDPPLVMACMDRTANTHVAVEGSGVFALNILPLGARDLAHRFASSSPDKFAGVEIEYAASGAPLLSEALAFCDCEVTREVAAGDHTIFIGRVLHARVREAADPTPLLYFRGGYGSFGAGEAG